MTRWFLVGFAVIGVLVLATLHLIFPAAQAGADAPVPALSGKPVLIRAKDKVAFTLEKAEVRQLGGRSFVVGREMKNSPYQLTRELYDGGMVWVPMDVITSLVELEPGKREK